MVIVGSRMAEGGGAGAAAYAVSKCGVLALTRILALENQARGVRVNGILPGTIDTPANRTAMPTADRSSWTTPEALARIIAFLLSPDSAPVTGAIVPVDAPRLARAAVGRCALAAGALVAAAAAPPARVAQRLRDRRRDPLRRHGRRRPPGRRRRRRRRAHQGGGVARGGVARQGPPHRRRARPLGDAGPRRRARPLLPVRRRVHAPRRHRPARAIAPTSRRSPGSRRRLDRRSRATSSCGVTSVVDAGGPMWNFEVRDRAARTTPRPAGGGGRPAGLDGGAAPARPRRSADRQGRLAGRRRARSSPRRRRATPTSSRSGSSSGRADDPVAGRALLDAVVDEARRGGLRVAVHATELAGARAAVEAGAAILVHSVFDQPVDDAFVAAVRDKGVVYVPRRCSSARVGTTSCSPAASADRAPNGPPGRSRRAAQLRRPQDLRGVQAPGPGHRGRAALATGP